MCNLLSAHIEIKNSFSDKQYLCNLGRKKAYSVLHLHIKPKKINPNILHHGLENVAVKI